MSFESHPVLCDYAYYTIIWEAWSKKNMNSKPSIFSLSSQNLQKCVHWTNLCNHLPGSGSVLARLDAKVPPPLEDEDNRLSWDVEAGGPTHLQLTRGEFLKGQFLPWFQRSTWKTNIFLLSQPIFIPSAPVLNALSRLIMSWGIPFGIPGQWGQRVPCMEHKKPLYHTLKCVSAKENEVFQLCIGHRKAEKNGFMHNDETQSHQK